MFFFLFFFFMWEFQTNSAWNVRCVFKMMHLILKSTSQEIQYKIDRSLESVALLSIWEAIQSSFFLHQQRRLLVCTWQTLIVWFKFLKDIWGKRRPRLEESHIICKHARAEKSGSMCTENASPFCAHFAFWPLGRWRADTRRPDLSGGVGV